MKLRYKCLTEWSLPPRKASPDSISYDLFMPIDFTIKPKARRVVYTDLAFGIPEGHYGRVASKFRLAVKFAVDVKAGVINCGYTGNVGVVLKNDSGEPFSCERGEPIAQLILERACDHPLEEVQELSPTAFGTASFGQQMAAAYGKPSKPTGKLP